MYCLTFVSCNQVRVKNTQALQYCMISFKNKMLVYKLEMIA